MFVCFISHFSADTTQTTCSAGMSQRTALSSLGLNQLNARHYQHKDTVSAKGLYHPDLAPCQAIQKISLDESTHSDADGVFVSYYAREIMNNLHIEEKKRMVKDVSPERGVPVYNSTFKPA